MVLSISKAIKDKECKEARDAIPVGVHVVDFCAHIKGALKVGDDEEYTPTAQLPVLGILALAAQYCGITRESLLKAVLRIANEVHEENQKPGERAIVKIGDKIKKLAPEIGQFFDEIKEKFQESLPPTPRKGKVTTALNVEIVPLQTEERKIVVDKTVVGKKKAKIATKRKAAVS